MRKSKVYSVSDEEFVKIIQTSASIAECCMKLNLSPNGMNGKQQIKKRCKELNVDLNLSPKKRKYVAHCQYDLNEILVSNSSYMNRTRLKKRIIDSGILEYKCSSCGNCGEWNGKRLCLQIDHINGINNDNRIENLRFLCPNCHSQTRTFSGKNKKITR